MRLAFLTQAALVLCALALVFVAFGQRLVDADPRLSDPQIAAYLAPGGLLADLCMSGEKGQEQAAHADCLACTIAKTMVLASADLAPSDLVLRSGHRAALPAAFVLTGHGPRAPPARGALFIQLI